MEDKAVGCVVLRWHRFGGTLATTVDAAVALRVGADR